MSMHYLQSFIGLYDVAIEKLETYSGWLPQLALRLILAWEFGEAGYEKLHGTNWFADLSFPFPFNLLPPDISWGVATFFEIVGAFALTLGLATRFFSFSLIVLTIVAIASVHWPEHWSNLSELVRGYRIIDENNDGFGNYKLPLLFIVMFLPLLFSGAGKASLDYLIKKYMR
ncbi:MAG TPA: DoxX family protein [Methylophilus sp.]|nr:DoxX family protein [Methylophilus sp.]HQQ34050.1 DoxX family protein [Methylophilus sp.]